MSKTTITSKTQGRRLIGRYDLENYVLVNCTGNINSWLTVLYYADGSVILNGRLTITNFVRTGANPGITFNLPSAIPTPTISQTTYICPMSFNPHEVGTLVLNANSKLCRLNTTETFLNAPNGSITFIVDTKLTFTN